MLNNRIVSGIITTTLLLTPTNTVSASTNVENERRLFDYIYGRNGNQGNFLINTRTNNDIISKFEIL